MQLNIFSNTLFLILTLNKCHNSSYISLYLTVNRMVIPQTLAQYLNYVLILSIFKHIPNFSFRLEQVPLKIIFLDIQHNSPECEFATQWLGNDS